MVQSTLDIQTLQGKASYFAFPQDFDPDALLESSLDIVFDDPIHVSIWIAKGQARYVLERTYFQDQQVQHQENGSIITMQTSGWDDVKRWVLEFGPKAVVLEPRELRERICQDLSSCLSLYTSDILPAETFAAML